MQTERRRFLAGASATIAWLALGGTRTVAAATNDGFPARPISSIVAASAGGGFDLLLRMVQPAWEKRLGRPLRANFAPGAAGQIAVTQLLSQPVDGYSFVLDAMTNQAVMIHFNHPNRFSFDSLDYLGTLQVEPVALLVRKDSRFADIGAFLKAAREGSSPVKLGVGGNRTFYNLVAAAFKKEAKATNMNIIAYGGGGGPSRTALLGGEIDAVVTGLYAASPIFDRVRGLVVFDDANPIPETLPMQSASALGFKLPATLHPTCIVVPAELKKKFPAHHEVLSRTFGEAMSDPGTVAAAAKLGLPKAAVVNWGPDRLEAYKGQVRTLLDQYGNLL